MNSIGISSIFLIVINIINSFYPQSMLVNFQSKNEEVNDIVDKVIEEKGKYVVVDVIIPIIKNIENKKREDEINNKIQKWTEEWINDIKLIAKENLDTNVAPLFPYEANAKYQVKNNKTLLSLYIDYYQYTGGAHGITTRKPYNIDKKSGNELNVKDLFSEGYDYRNTINKVIKGEIEKNKDMYFTGSEGFSGIKDNQGFYIEDDNLVIYFGQYEIAPYAAGMPEFKLPLEMFKNNYLYDRINSK